MSVLIFCNSRVCGLIAVHSTIICPSDISRTYLGSFDEDNPWIILGYLQRYNIEEKMSQNQQEPRVKKEHPTHLSAIITSLLSAFESTRHLYQRIKNDTRSSSKKLNKRIPSTGPAVATPQTRDERELQLHLQRAPRQIAKIFKTNSERLGEGYRRGDGAHLPSFNLRKD